MNLYSNQSVLKISTFLIIFLILFVPVSYAQICAVSLEKDALSSQIQSLMESEYLNEEKEVSVRGVYFAFIYEEALRLVDESDANSFVVFLQQNQDLETLDLAIIYNAFFLKDKYGISDEELIRGIKNQNLLEFVSEKAGLIGESDAKSLKEKKILQKGKSLVSSPFLVSSVLAMTLVLSTIIKSNVATNEAIGRELAMGSKASVSVVVNAPSTEVFQTEQSQETVEDVIPTQELEIQGAPSLEGYDDYNKVQPILNEFANKYGIDSNILAAIILQESNGDSNVEGDSQETIRKSRYEAIKKAFTANQNYQEYYKALKEKGVVNNEEEFFKLVSKFSYGLFQISPQTAALRGFRDNPEKLKDARINIEIAIKELIAKGFNSDDNGIAGLTKAAQIINRGRQGLTPHEGYLESAQNYYEQLEKQSDLNNKGIHCKKGSTECFLEADDVVNAKLELYEVFKKRLEKEGKTIPPIDEFFVEEEITSNGIRLKTESEVPPDEVENEFKGKITLEVILDSSNKELSDLEKNIDSAYFRLIPITKNLESLVEKITSVNPDVSNGQYTPRVQSIDINAQHTIDYNSRIKTRLPSFILDKIMQGRKISLHMGSSAQAIFEMKQRGFTDFAQIDIFVELTTWKLWVATNDKGDLEYFISDIRGISRLNHIEAMLKLSKISESSIVLYDYKTDYSGEFQRTLEDIVEDKKPDIILLGDQSVLIDGFLRDGYQASSKLDILKSILEEGRQNGLTYSDSLLFVFSPESSWFDIYYSKKVLLSSMRTKLSDYLKKSGRTKETTQIMKEISVKGISRDILEKYGIPVEDINNILSVSGAQSKQDFYNSNFASLRDELKELINSYEDINTLLNLENEKIIRDRVVSKRLLLLFSGLSAIIDKYNLQNEFVDFNKLNRYFEKINSPNLPFFIFKIKTKAGGSKIVLLTSNPYGDLSGELLKGSLDYSSNHKLDDIIFLGAGGGINGVNTLDIYFPNTYFDGETSITIPNYMAKKYEEGEIRTEKTKVVFTEHALVDTVFEETLPFMKDLQNKGVQTLEVEVGYIVNNYLAYIDTVLDKYKTKLSEEEIAKLKQNVINYEEINDDLLISLGITDAALRTQIISDLSKIPKLSILQHVSDMPMLEGQTLQDLGHSKPLGLQNDKYGNLLMNFIDMEKIDNFAEN